MPTAAVNCIGWSGTCCNIPGYTVYPSSDGQGTIGDISFDWSLVGTSYWNIYESVQVQRACDIAPDCNGFVYKPASGEAVLKAGAMQPLERLGYDNWCFYIRTESMTTDSPPPLEPQCTSPPGITCTGTATDSAVGSCSSAICSTGYIGAVSGPTCPYQGGMWIFNTGVCRAGRNL